MFSSDQYELVDFGAKRTRRIGNKLERFNGVLVSRPSPAAGDTLLNHHDSWIDSDATFTITEKRAGQSKSDVKGQWSFRDKLPEPWLIRHHDFSLKLKPTPFGHLGVFVEQQTNWDWITSKVRSASRTLKVLNMFAYTGGSTLAAAAAGAEVVHLDSSKSVVNWARENASLSGLDDRPIRWIVEDCSLFVKREQKRGNKYDAIILDPPSFGHGPKGERWRIDLDLIKLLRNCKTILSDSPEFVVLSCHSAGFGPAELQALLCDSIFGTCSAQVNAMPLSLNCSDGRNLNAGCVARWPR